MAERMVDKIAAALALPLLDNLLGVAPNFVSSRVRQVSVEASNQCLTYVRMELRLKQRPMRILASKDPLLENTLIHQLFQVFSNVLEVLAHFIFDAALSVTALVASEPIAPPTAGQRMEQVLAFGEFAQAKIEDSGAMFVQKDNGQKR